MIDFQDQRPSNTGQSDDGEFAPEGSIKLGRVLLCKLKYEYLIKGI